MSVTKATHVKTTTVCDDYYRPAKDLFTELQNSLADKVGQHFFDSAVILLNKLLDADITLIGSLLNEALEVNTLAICNRDGGLPNIKYSLRETPCEDVNKRGSCIIKNGVAELYSEDTLLKEMGIEGYVGISIFDSSSKPIGIIVCLFRNSVENSESVLFTLELLSQRIKVEMERLKMEQSLRDQQDRYEFALNAGGFGIYDWNIYTDEIIFNNRMFEIIERSPGEFQPTFANWVELIHPEDYERLSVSIARNVSEGREYYEPIQYRIRKKSGNYKWIEVYSYSFYFDTKKKAKRNVGVVKEVDDEVRKENQLKEALAREIELNQQIKQREEWYSFALKVGNLAVYDWYVKEDRAILSPRFYEMLGCEQNEVNISFQYWLTLIHPDDLHHFNWQNYRERTTHRNNKAYLYRVQHKSGNYLWVEAQNMAIEQDKNGHIIRMVGIVKDVDTEKRSSDLLHHAYERQKKLNEELKKREKELTESQVQLISQMTMLQKLNKELRDSDNRWKYALQSNGDGVIEWNVATNDCYFSNRAKEILDFPLQDENDYRLFMKHIHPLSQMEFIAHLEQCIKPPYNHFSMEVQVLNSQNNYRWIMFRGKVVEVDELGNPFKMVGTVTDLSSHKAFQKELTIYEEMIKQNQSAIIFTSINGVIEFANDTAANLLGYKQHEIIEKGIKYLLPENWEGRLLYEDFRGVQDFVTKSKRKITTQVATSLIRQDDEPIGFALNIMDITERKRLEDEVNALTMAKLTTELEIQQQQKEMIINVQEKEKGSIARELHDGVGQSLSLVKLQLEQLESGLSGNLQQQCKNLIELMQNVTTDIKGLTSDLMPLSIRNLGLESGMSSLLERYKSIKGKEVSFFCKIQLDGFEPDPDTAIHMYRIAQEALNNSMKYSNASSASLILIKLKNSLNLMLEDNGIGFDITSQIKKKNSFGLKTMMERAKLINGKLLINSSSESGTTISLTVPLITVPLNLAHD